MYRELGRELAAKGIEAELADLLKATGDDTN
jgi:hypothetical protein